MGCVFSNARMGHEVAVPRPVAVRALAAVAEAAADRARDRWQRELAAWLGEQARAIALGACGLEIALIAWTPDHFAEQQAFALAMVAAGAFGTEAEVRVALDRLAALIAGHQRAWVISGRRWLWPDGAPAVP